MRGQALGEVVRRRGLPAEPFHALVEANRASLRITSRKGEGTLVEVLFPAGRVLEA